MNYSTTIKTDSDYSVNRTDAYLRQMNPLTKVQSNFAIYHKREGSFVGIEVHFFNAQILNDKVFVKTLLTLVSEMLPFVANHRPVSYKAQHQLKSNKDFKGSIRIIVEGQVKTFKK